MIFYVCMICMYIVMEYDGIYVSYWPSYVLYIHTFTDKGYTMYDMYPPIFLIISYGSLVGWLVVLLAQKYGLYSVQ